MSILKLNEAIVDGSGSAQEKVKRAESVMTLDGGQMG